MICGKKRRLSLRPTLQSARASLHGETGQVLVFVVLAMVVLLAMTGFAIDVGRAYFTQRSMQASADAAALAGAQELPDPGFAVSVADAYSGKNGGKNQDPGVDGVSTNIYTKCLKSAPGCEPVNAVVVEQTKSVSTLFASILGIDTIGVDVKSTACSPCAAKPLDIMLVLDRTGSMCDVTGGTLPPGSPTNCRDLEFARDGMKTFLGFMDPTIDHVGLAVLPPGTACGTPPSGLSGYDNASAPYVLVPLSNDYTADGALNPKSNLVKTIMCQRAGGNTSYANALEKAQGELDAHGRPDVKDIIVFLTDGGANTGPSYGGAPYSETPCHQGVNSAAAIKSRGTIIYTIGYDLDSTSDGQICKSRYDKNPKDGNQDVELGINARSALQQIATSSTTFFNKPTPGQLKSIFTKIAADISRPAARLIDNDID